METIRVLAGDSQEVFGKKFNIAVGSTEKLSGDIDNLYAAAEDLSDDISFLSDDVQELYDDVEELSNEVEELSNEVEELSQKAPPGLILIEGESETVQGWGFACRAGSTYGAIGKGAVCFVASVAPQMANIGATGAHSFAFGQDNQASGKASFAGGSSCMAGAENAVALGDYTEATHDASFVAGGYLESTTAYSAVFGIYNSPDSHDIFQVGIGNVEADEAANGLTVSRSGKVRFPAVTVESLIDEVDTAGTTVAAVINNAGVSSNRPSHNGASNLAYFDTDLNKPIWYNGTSWVDATGTAVE